MKGIVVSAFPYSTLRSHSVDVNFVRKISLKAYLWGRWKLQTYSEVALGHLDLSLLAESTESVHSPYAQEHLL